MKGYVFALSVDGRQTYVEEVMAVTDENAIHAAIDRLAAMTDTHPWTFATPTAADGRVLWLMTAGNRKKD